jgi:hypothetical protein
MGHGVADLEHSVPPDNYGFSGFAKKKSDFCRYLPASIMTGQRQYDMKYIIQKV